MPRDSIVGRLNEFHLLVITSKHAIASYNAKIEATPNRQQPKELVQFTL